jgi:hypothetical protein
MVVFKLLAIVGIDTAKIRLAVPAKKLPSAALIKSNQLVRESIAESLTLPSPSNGEGRVRVAGDMSRDSNALLYVLDPKSRHAKPALVPLPIPFDKLDAKLQGRLGVMRDRSSGSVTGTGARVVKLFQAHGLHSCNQSLDDRFF